MKNIRSILKLQEAETASMVINAATKGFHRISINHDLNLYAFSHHIIHEVAHLNQWKRKSRLSFRTERLERRVS